MVVPVKRYDKTITIEVLGKSPSIDIFPVLQIDEDNIWRATLVDDDSPSSGVELAGAPASSHTPDLVLSPADIDTALRNNGQVCGDREALTGTVSFLQADLRSSQADSEILAQRCTLLHAMLDRTGPRISELRRSRQEALDNVARLRFIVGQLTDVLHKAAAPSDPSSEVAELGKRVEVQTAQVESLQHIQADLVQALATANRRADEATARNSSLEPSDLRRQVTDLEDPVDSLTRERDRLHMLADIAEPRRVANQELVQRSKLQRK